MFEKIVKLQQELQQTKLELQKKENELEREIQLYQQLNSSSQVEISQERNATIHQINTRIEHELKKLERCLNSKNIDNWVENQQIGLRLIEKIKKQLIEE